MTKTDITFAYHNAKNLAEDFAGEWIGENAAKKIAELEQKYAWLKESVCPSNEQMN